MLLWCAVACAVVFSVLRFRFAPMKSILNITHTQLRVGVASVHECGERAPAWQVGTRALERRRGTRAWA